VNLNDQELHRRQLSTQRLNICGILGSTGCSFVGDEILPTNETHWYIAIEAGGFSFLGLLPSDATNSRDDIDPQRRHTKLGDPARRREIILGKVERTEAEIIESMEDAFSIFARRPDEQVYIPGDARSAMERQGITADDEVFNPMSVEQLEQLFEIGANFHSTRV